MYAEEMLSEPVSTDDGIDVQGIVRIYREIRLTLGPTVIANTLGPMFVSRARAELEVFGNQKRQAWDELLDVSFVEFMQWPKAAPSFPVAFKDGWRRATLLADVVSLEDSF